MLAAAAGRGASGGDDDGDEFADWDDEGDSPRTASPAAGEGASSGPEGPSAGAGRD